MSVETESNRQPMENYCTTTTIHCSTIELPTEKKKKSPREESNLRQSTTF